MRYDDQDRSSSNIEDRRSQRRGFRFPGGFGRGRGRRVRLPMGRKGGFSLTTLLILGAIMLFFGINPLELLTGNMGGGGPRSSIEIPQLPRSDTSSRSPSGSGLDIPGLPGSTQKPAASNSPEEEMKLFIGRVLADTEEVWHRVFKSFGKTYDEPKLVLFRDYTPTGCGTGQATMGPFYCPLDRKIYIDMSFFDELKRKFSAPGDFAQAYVIAHEVGHHVQTILGISSKVQSAKRRSSKKESNRLQVRMELQADCLAGVWAARNDQLNNRLEPGDIQEGLNAASQIGDDMIQRRQQGYVVPDAFTHGTAAQRQRWFLAGFEQGKVQACQPAFELPYERL